MSGVWNFLSGLNSFSVFVSGQQSEWKEIQYLSFVSSRLRFVLRLLTPPHDVRFLRLSLQTTTKSDDDVRYCICKFVVFMQGYDHDMRFSDDDVRSTCAFVFASLWSSCSLMTTCRITTAVAFCCRVDDDVQIVKHPSLTTSHQSDPCELRHASAATIRPPCSMATAWAPATHLPRRAAH